MKPDKPTSKERVQHVLQAIDSIESFTQSHTMNSFLHDEKTISACLYQFTIIGEATFHIESGILENYSYPWHRVKSFRNFILHDYHGIEMWVVWKTLKEILPELKELMQEILKNEF